MLKTDLSTYHNVSYRTVNNLPKFSVSLLVQVKIVCTVHYATSCHVCHTNLQLPKYCSFLVFVSEPSSGYAWLIVLSFWNERQSILALEIELFSYSPIGPCPFMHSQKSILCCDLETAIRLGNDPKLRQSALRTAGYYFRVHYTRFIPITANIHRKSSRPWPRLYLQFAFVILSRPS